MLGRNRELKRFVVTFLLVSAVMAGTAWVLGGRIACAWVLACAIALALVCGCYTYARYRAIAHMGARVDAVLHGERSLELEGMDEGELSSLASELEKMVARLNLTVERLERESASLATSLADISHQLKTPLTSSAILCELMRTRLLEHPQGIDGAEVSQMVARLRTVQQLQERVQWLVAALLRLARIDAGVVKLACAPVDVERMVHHAAASLAVAFDVAGVRLETRMCPGATYEGDAAWSGEALANVLKNCMEHTPAGGVVRVEVTSDALACRIRVEDTGPGIAEEDLPHVFERFYRGHTPAPDGAAAISEANPAGVGIGLALARSLVAAQGGTIKAANARDRAGRITGARFDLVFFKAVV